MLEAAQEIFRAVALDVSLALLFALAVALAVSFLGRHVRRAWDALGRWGRAAFIVGGAVATIYGGGKSGTITYPYLDVEHRYLTDTGSYVTNDYVHVAFARSVIVPTSAPLLIDRRAVGSTNSADWVNHVTTTFAAFAVPQDIQFAAANSNDWIVYTTWAPDPTAHTNGVAMLQWRQRTTNTLATIRTGIYIDARRIAPNPAVTNGPAAFAVAAQAPNESESEGGDE